MLLYVSGPYSGDIDSNIAAARAVAVELWNAGHAVICPHLNTAHMEQDCAATYDQYIAGDLNMIARCDGLVMVPGWPSSRGANIERDYAHGLSIPVREWPEFPPPHSTEVGSPEQVRGFREVVGRMYRVHLDKNADYSPANILATGEVGLVTRLWDKVARLLSLTGFSVEVNVKPGGKPRSPKAESVDDTYLDLAVYGIIGLLLRRGQWGR